jgi:ferrochelatase
MKTPDSTNFDHKKPMKTGVLLVNLGTPTEPTPAAVRVYLKEFLSDSRVVEIPKVIWWFILNLIILPFRSKRSAAAYQSIWQKSGSPLLINTKNLTNKVAQKLSQKSDQVIVDYAMRYGSDNMVEKLKLMEEQGVNKLLVIPLYPQYSATTTASIFDVVGQYYQQQRRIPDIRFVSHYHDNDNYIKALVDKVKYHWEVNGKAEKLMLSFHGIPQRNWDKGDPYACECFKTARLVAEQLELSSDQILTTFQSRFGKAQWIQPYTEATLKAEAAKGTSSVQVICPGFAVDCLETLEEIAEENKEYFIEAGGQKFEYIECLNDDDSHVDMMCKLIEDNTQGW